MFPDKYRSKLSMMGGKTPFVTFIIPSIGRSSLGRALDSVRAQTDSDWEAIVCFDECNPTIAADGKVRVLRYSSPVPRPRSGLVRNYAISQATSPWVAMLDDDDSVSPDYVRRLKKEIKDNPGSDVVVFRMMYSNGKILPTCGTDVVAMGRIGISFALKTDLAQSIRFKHGICVDYKLLNEAKGRDSKITFSRLVSYIVRGGWTYGRDLLFPKFNVSRETTAVMVNYKTVDLVKICPYTFRSFYPDMFLVVVDCSGHDDATKSSFNFVHNDKRSCLLTLPDTVCRGSAINMVMNIVNTDDVFLFDSDVRFLCDGLVESLREKRCAGYYGVGEVKDTLSLHAVLLNRLEYLKGPPFVGNVNPHLAAMRSGPRLVSFDVSRFLFHEGGGTAKRLKNGQVLGKDSEEVA